MHSNCTDKPVIQKKDYQQRNLRTSRVKVSTSVQGEQNRQTTDWLWLFCGGTW